MTKTIGLRDSTFMLLNSNKISVESWSDYLERMYEIAHPVKEVKH